jgi:hypothetical protein
MITMSETAAFNLASSTFLILECCLNGHAFGIFSHTLMGSSQVRDQKPSFLISDLPTGTQPDFIAMFLPQQNLSIPVLPFFTDKERSCLPILVPVTKLAAEMGIIFDPQDVMPSHFLAQVDQGEATQTTICQQRHPFLPKKRGDLLKEIRHDLPLPAIPLLLLWH